MRPIRILPILVPVAAIGLAAIFLFASAGMPGPIASPSGSQVAEGSAASPADSAASSSAPSSGASTGSSPTAIASQVASLVASATPKPATPAPTKTAPCPIFPASNVWNKAVSGLPVAGNSAQMIAAIGLDAYLHPDFNAIGDGIPFNAVASSTPRYSVTFRYADESDAGPYPIPASPAIEKGSDRHMLMLDSGACMLYELYAVSKSGSNWSAGSGAIWNLRSNALRPAGWTSADAAGLPILPGLVRYDEVRAGAIRHAIRFTAPHTCGYIYPARHQTAAPCSNLPPMGLRVRLKASVDISGFGAQGRVVLTALKTYGMILADNGSPWFITGTPDSRWNDDQLHAFHQLTGADFEVVDTSGLRNG